MNEAPETDTGSATLSSLSQQRSLFPTSPHHVYFGLDVSTATEHIYTECTVMSYYLIYIAYTSVSHAFIHWT